MTRFENLPEHLIHYIMNFLPCEDATKLSVLSQAFHSWWLSFPVLEFDDVPFQYEDGEQIFFPLILKTLQLRSPHINNSLQKCRLFHSPWPRNKVPLSYQHTFDELVDFAVLENKCEEIVFCITSSCYMKLRYKPLYNLFSSEFLTVLTLCGLRIPIADHIIHCRKLKALTIRRSKGLRTITVSSLCVKEVEIRDCFGLEGIQVPNAKNLIKFGFGFTGLSRPCDFDLPACESIKSMFLFCLKVSENDLTVPVTDTLSICYCDLPMEFRIQNAKLKELYLSDVSTTGNLFLLTPNLERFCYSGIGFDSYQIGRVTLNISACVALSVLELEGVAITDDWVKSAMPNLVSLKELKMTRCGDLMKMELKNDSLEILSLNSCPDLKEAIIDAPNLLKFHSKRSLQVYPLTILSTKCCAKIELPPCYTDPISWYYDMNRFLSSFYHIQRIIIVYSEAKDLIFPVEHMAENNPFPLLDLKYLELMGEPDSQDVMKIIEGLLWLVPKPLELTLLSMREKIIGNLKFEYGKEVKRMKIKDGCCFGIHSRCWRHYELKVDIQGFNESETRDLNCFFSHYMH